MNIQNNKTCLSYFKKLDYLERAFFFGGFLEINCQFVFLDWLIKRKYVIIIFFKSNLAELLLDLKHNLLELIYSK